ncbi:MAG: hypothetical protein RLZZ546_2375 [Bacteroidota bacterium]|jgi:uncharacterized RDD family membrane protein YckC
MYFIDEDHIEQKPSYTMADFWPRVGASFIDACILMPIVAVNYLNFFSWKNVSIFLVATFVQVSYKPIMEFKYGATFGKKIFGLKVIDDSTHNINFNQAILRSIFSLLSVLISLSININMFTSNDIMDINTLDELTKYFDNFPVLQLFQSVLITTTFIDILFLLFFYDQRKTLHDIISRTKVIYSRKLNF